MVVSFLCIKFGISFVLNYFLRHFYQKCDYLEENVVSKLYKLSIYFSKVNLVNTYLGTLKKNLLLCTN